LHIWVHIVIFLVSFTFIVIGYLHIWVHIVIFLVSFTFIVFGFTLLG